MFSEIKNTELMKGKIFQRLSETTGINNNSKSSVMSHIVDAISGAISDSSSYNASIINSTFTENTSGDLLTDNAYEFGVIRNIYSDLYIRDQDKILFVSTTDGKTFPRFSDGKMIIKAGTRYTVGDSTLEVLQDVYVSSSFSEIPVSARLVSSSATDIKVGSEVQITDPKNIHTSGIVLKFNAPVYNRLFEEDDDSLRSRTIDAKMKVHGSSNIAISGIVKYIPGVHSHYIEEDNSSGVTNIYIVTDKTKEGEEDGIIPAIRGRILSRLDTLASAEQAFNIMQPEKLKIFPIFTYSNTTGVIALSAIKEAFDLTYSTFDREFDIELLKLELEEYGIDVEISAIVIKSDKFGIVEQYESGTVNLPEASILVFSASEAIGEQV